MGILNETILSWKAGVEKVCKQCNGTGLAETKLQSQDGWQYVVTKCDGCKGSGIGR